MLRAMRSNGTTTVGHRPLIGITVGASMANDGFDYARLRMTYVRAVEAAGGQPVLLPPTGDEAGLAELLRRLDGLLLPGGVDIDPVRYGESMNGSEAPNPGLDQLELTAARCAAEQDVPTLGICRGQQVINVALGGSLLQHMDGHAPSGPREKIHHGLRVAAGSKLANVLGGTELDVNSHHHQAVKRLGSGLVAVAWAEDGTVEGIEAPDRTWFLAVQFHPEDLVPRHSASKQLLEAFVAACAAAELTGAPS
jgi:putative glutamine amidotransferase